MRYQLHDGSKVRVAPVSYPGPSELRPHLLTRSEMAAMLEHILYRADGSVRSTLARIMPDAYVRLTGIDLDTLGKLRDNDE